MCPSPPTPLQKKAQKTKKIQPPSKEQSRFLIDAVMQGKIFGDAKPGKHNISNVSAKYFLQDK